MNRSPNHESPGFDVAEDDAALVRRCLANEGPALREFVERFQGVLFGLCQRMIHHREDAEDVVQETFLRAFRSLRRWDETRPLKPWLLKIAANRCRTHLSKRAKAPVLAVIDDVSAGAPGPEVHGLAEELQAALGQLRGDQRACFVLYYQQELSCAEIAEILSCPVGTVKTWLHRARHELADYLKRRGVTPHVSTELQRI